MNTQTVSKILMKFTAGFAAILFAGTAFAEPALQIDIDGGTYDLTTEDVVTSSTTFTLLALCSPSGTQSSADCVAGTDYYLSIALTSDSPISDVGGDYGSIDITVFGVTTTIAITGDMVYGVPPVDEYLQLHDSGDLPSHGVFPTWFTDVLMNFDDDNTCGPNNYDVSPVDGHGPGNCDRTGTNSHFVAVDFDVSGLADGFGLHFDLYDEVLLSNQSDADNDVDQEGFAPPSHDASYVCCERKVPEPGSIGLLGIGLLGLGLARRRKLKA